jgi:hypothetical protein
LYPARCRISKVALAKEPAGMANFTFSILHHLIFH